MNVNLRLGVYFLVTLLVTVFASNNAYAYLDPGAGGMILQLIVGGIAGGLLVLKLYWYRIKSKAAALFGRNLNEAQTPQTKSCTEPLD